ncbi:hypothetical protein AXG93_496s1200 [Marchantia polymorpha subsp. ruderalis]|uniref:Uncharacterized protein n=1 Tax=Marchantia polymorpha subsp. ruderalis TaxID=1480154 RepID=A0A176VPK9_MARPO|nr:hypothetical protein AXG93_496s1200 [Marchantia polymorpha subsp. ruderalis]
MSFYFFFASSEAVIFFATFIRCLFRRSEASIANPVILTHPLPPFLFPGSRPFVGALYLFRCPTEGAREVAIWISGRRWPATWPGFACRVSTGTRKVFIPGGGNAVLNGGSDWKGNEAPGALWVQYRYVEQPVKGITLTSAPHGARQNAAGNVSFGAKRRGERAREEQSPDRPDVATNSPAGDILADSFAQGKRTPPLEGRIGSEL